MVERVVCASGVHATVRLLGDLDARSAVHLEREVQELIDAGAHTITIHLGQLAFVDRAGRKAVADASDRLDRLGGSLRVVRRTT